MKIMEKIDIYINIRVTYGELESVLKKLGYERKLKDDAIAFTNKKYDSIILLTKKRRNALVFPPVLSGESYILYMKGVIENRKDLFEMILEEQALRKAKKAKAAA